MKTESNTQPETLQIRKLGVIDTEPVVYLYLNSDITQEVKLDIDGEPRPMYMYDTMQITNPVPAELLPEIDLTLIADHSYNQTTEKQLASTHLDDVKQTINNAAKHRIKHVDRLDRLTDITDADLTKIQKHTKPETKI